MLIHKIWLAIERLPYFTVTFFQKNCNFTKIGTKEALEIFALAFNSLCAYYHYIHIISFFLIIYKAFAINEALSPTRCQYQSQV
jgi:hypothetical protein